MSELKTSEKLVQALKENNAPQWLIDKANAGEYGDFTSPYATPLVELYRRCVELELTGMLMRIKMGEFDATEEENQAWAREQGGDKK